MHSYRFDSYLSYCPLLELFHRMVYFLTFSDVPANWLVSTSGYLIYYNWELRFINGIETKYHGKNHFGRKVFIRSKTVYKIVSLNYQHPNLNELKIVFIIIISSIDWTLNELIITSV